MRYLKGPFGVPQGYFWSILEGSLEYLKSTFWDTFRVHFGYLRVPCGIVEGYFWGTIARPLRYIEGTFWSTLRVHLRYFEGIF